MRPLNTGQQTLFHTGHPVHYFTLDILYTISHWTSCTLFHTGHPCLHVWHIIFCYVAWCLIKVMLIFMAIYRLKVIVNIFGLDNFDWPYIYSQVVEYSSIHPSPTLYRGWHHPVFEKQMHFHIHYINNSRFSFKNTKKPTTKSLLMLFWKPNSLNHWIWKGVACQVYLVHQSPIKPCFVLKPETIHHLRANISLSLHNYPTHQHLAWIELFLNLI